MKIHSRKAFSLIELMIAVLLMSVLGMGLAKYFKSSTKTLSDSQGQQESVSAVQRIQKLLRDDLQQTVFLNPSCTSNAAPNVTVTTTCTNLKIRSGVTPFPAHTVDDMDALTTMALPSNLTDSAASLTGEFDAIRLMLYEGEAAYNCRLNRDRRVNPLLNSGTGSGNEMIYADTDCGSLIAEGKLYVLTEVFDNDTNDDADSTLEASSNLFQVTTLSTSVLEYTITASSVSNIYNQVGGLGLSGYSNLARIYPVYFVEWAFQPEGGSRAAGIYRRTISPSASDTTGKGEWKLIEPQAVGLQFGYVTLPPSGAISHNRTMDFEADPASTDYDANNGVEDIRGVIPYVVLRGETSRSDGKTFDNPMTAATETSAYPMSELVFQMDLRNAN